MKVPSCLIPLHLPAWLVLRLRVAPYPASLGRAERRFFGLPRFLVLWLCRLMDLRVAPNLASVRAFGFLILQVAPVPQSSCRASDTALRLPLVLHLRLCRRPIFESPRISHPSAVPTGRSSGCPVSRSFGIAVIRSPGCPEFRTFRLRLMDPRVTPVRAPSGYAIGESPGLPKASYPPATPV